MLRSLGKASIFGGKRQDSLGTKLSWKCVQWWRGKPRKDKKVLLHKICLILQELSFQAEKYNKGEGSEDFRKQA